MGLKKFIGIVVFLALINFDAFGKGAKEEYLIVQLSSDIEDIESEANSNGEDSFLTCNDYESSFSENGFLHKFLITEDFNIVNNHNDKLEFKYSGRGVEYPLYAVKSIGFLFEESSEASIEEVEVSPFTEGWRIYGLDGTLIESVESGEPSFSMLELGKIYIVVNKNKRYKYRRWK